VKNLNLFLHVALVPGLILTHTAFARGLPTETAAVANELMLMHTYAEDATPADRTMFAEQVVRSMQRDSLECAPSYTTVMDFFRTQRITATAIRGTVSYAGTMPLPYAYDVADATPLGSRIDVRICLRNEALLTSGQVNEFDTKLRDADSLWTAAAPRGVTFRFRRSCTNAHFTVDYVNTDGPYTASLPMHLSHLTFAHEVGHMMGMDDYYGINLWSYLNRNSTVCSMESIMCAAERRGQVTEAEIYQVLRRVYCAQTGSRT
jgi:hypothetical protein